MPYFVVYALDAPDRADLRAAHRPAHRARLRDPGENAVKVHIGGPLMNDAGDMNGSMLVIEAATQDAVETFVAGDPYTKAGLYQSVQITAFAWGLGQPKEVIYG